VSPGAGGAADPWRRRVDDVARLVLDVAMPAAPTLGEGRLVCLDGPAGSGKSTLAASVAEAASREGTARVVHVDDLLEGWGGLSTLDRAVGELLGLLAVGRASGFRPHDWCTGGSLPWTTVAPVDLLCLEGVGAWSLGHAHLVTVLVWVDLPEGLRRDRAGARDGDLSWWDDWARDEARVHARERTREHAGIHVVGDAHELRVELR
jgi:energy-coupling factor transporter ATP-binding protein EcfA2